MPQSLAQIYLHIIFSTKHADALCAYIKNQEEHHRIESFQDEFRRILRACGIEWDEKFVWD
jgi:hypothetical protein